MASHPGRLSPAEAVRIEDLVRSFDGRRVLDGLGLTVHEGEFVALLGRSGSGKSTLLRALARLDHDVDGDGLLTAPDNVSVVFQDARLLPWKRLLDNVVLGLEGPDAEERGRAALAEVGLAGRERAWPVELSGGEQQRVSLARSLVREPRLLLADEPFGALDALTRIRMHALLRTLCARHRPAVLLVTHDVDEAIALADRVVVLDHGRIAADLEVRLPAPRRAGTPEHGRLRDRLLTHLGVDLTDLDPGPDPDPGPALDPHPGSAPAPTAPESTAAVASVEATTSTGTTADQQKEPVPS
ncbi:ABC transporter ATP-binding protein [Streptomyces sp. NPDC002640]